MSNKIISEAQIHLDMHKKLVSLKNSLGKYYYREENMVLEIPSQLYTELNNEIIRTQNRVNELIIPGESHV